jgi:hypothetical protein
MSDAVERVLAALNAKDVEAFLSCSAADATIEDGADTVRVRGHRELRATTYGAQFERHPSLHVEAVHRTDAGPYVVQEERVTGRSPEPERHVAVSTLRDGVIARERLLR